MSSLPSKRWAIALVVSLALNLFLAGMWTARWVMRPAKPSHARIAPGIGAVRGHLDGPGKQIVDRIEAKRAPEIREQMRATRQARRRAMELLTAEDFDESKAREALNDFREKEAIARRSVHEGMLELAAELPAAQRKSLRRAWSPRQRRSEQRPRRAP